MKKNYLILLFLFVSAISFAQIATEKTLKNNAGIANPLMHEVKPIVSVEAPVFEKTPLPAQQKVSPEIFYIKDDQPVDRQKYMAARKSDSVKK